MKDKLFPFIQPFSFFLNNKKTTDISEKIMIPTVTHEIPKLKLLDTMVDTVKADCNFKNTVFVGAQHILETTVTLFQKIIDLGADPKNMYFTGKCYSTSKIVAKEAKSLGINLQKDGLPETIAGYEKTCNLSMSALWQTVKQGIKKTKEVERIIILDDGGRCITATPNDMLFDYPVIGIEQTRGGLYSSAVKHSLIPIIEPASSAGKRLIESPFIAAAIVKQAGKLIANYNSKPNAVFGITGNGAVGKALSKYLSDLGFNVIVYDEDGKTFTEKLPNKVIRVGNSDMVFANTDWAFGCVGRPIKTKTGEKVDIINLTKFKGGITVCNAGSEQLDYLPLLKEIEKQQSYENVLDTIVYETEIGDKIIIPNGGYPINFDRKVGNVPAYHIEITQALLLGSCIQAQKTPYDLNNPSGKAFFPKRYMLNPNIQSFVAKGFEQLNPNSISPSVSKKFDNKKCIISLSGGKYCPNPNLEKMFENIPSLEPYTEEEWKKSLINTFGEEALTNQIKKESEEKTGSNFNIKF